MTSGSTPVTSSGHQAARSRAGVEPGAVTGPQRQVLIALEGGPLTAREVAKRVRRSPHSARTLLLTLNGKGLVRRDQNASPVVWWRA